MLAVLEAAAGEQDGEIGVVVRVRIAHVAAVEHHGAIEEALAAFLLSGQAAEQFLEQRNLLAVGIVELTELAGCLAVMAQVVIAVCGVLAWMEFEDRSGEGIDHQRHDAGGIRFQGQSGHGEHEIELLEEQLLVLHIGGPRGGRGGRGALLPFAGDVGALFESAGNPLP